MKNILFILSILFVCNLNAQTPFPVYQPSATNADSLKHILNVNGAPRTIYNIDLVKNRFPVVGGSITGVGGNGYIQFIPQSANPSTPGSGFKLFASNAGAFSWLTSQGYMRELRVRAQTQNNIYYLQDKSYTLADSTDVASKLNIADTANIRLRPVAGTNISITGIYPNLTFNSTGGAGSQTLQQVLTAGATLTSANTITNNTYLRFAGAHTRIDNLAVGLGGLTGTEYLNIRPTLSNSKIITIPTLNGDAATGSQPYGHFYHTIEQNYVNPDGQRDAVYQWGYNQNGGGATVNTNEAEFHTALESHYQAFAGADPQFEYHIESTAKNSNKNRHFSMLINKNNGTGTSYWNIDVMTFNASNAGQANPYFSISNNGSTTIKGTSSRLYITNTSNTTTAGASQIESDPAGVLNIVNGGRGATNFINKITNPFTLSDSIGPVVNFQRGQNTSLYANSLNIYSNNNNSINLKSAGSTDNSIIISGFGGANGSNYGSIGNSSAAINLDTRGGIAPYRFFVGATNAMDIFTGGAVGIGTNNTAITPSLFSVKSTTKGAIPAPGMTKAQRNAIASPVDGLMVRVTDNGGYLSVYNATTPGWEKVSSVSDP